jgi:5'-3' exonuclease
MVDKWKAVRAHGWEADDLCHQWHKEILDEGIDTPVICSADKDMRTIPGIHCDIRHEGMPITHIDENTADYNFHKQLLMGDPSDNIKGIPWVGPVKADAVLKGIPFGARKQAVIKEYQKFYGKNWEKELVLTANLLYIRPDINQDYRL